MPSDIASKTDSCCPHLNCFCFNLKKGSHLENPQSEKDYEKKFCENSNNYFNCPDYITIEKAREQWLNHRKKPNNNP